MDTRTWILWFDALDEESQTAVKLIVMMLQRYKGHHLNKARDIAHAIMTAPK